METGSRFGSLVDSAIYFTCLLGLAGSAALAIYGLLTFPTPESGTTLSITKVFFLTLIPTGFAFVLRYQHLTRDRTQRDIAKNMYSGCPRWMKTSTYALMAIGVAIFFLPEVIKAVRHTTQVGVVTFNAISLGGFGLMAFPALIAQLYSANATLPRSSEPLRCAVEPGP